MRRIVMMVLRGIIFLPTLIGRLWYHAAHPDKYTDEEHNKLFKQIVSRANKGGNLILEGYGIENIPKENGFMLYPNHQGLYDMLALVGTCPNPLSAVAKKEVANIPFLKQVFACMKALMLDRKDVKQAMQVILAVVKEVKAGRNYVIFSEGTRSRDGNNTLEFKAGSFKVAEKARCPIVPVALIDSFKPFDVKSLKKITVQVHYLEPLLYEDYKDMNTNEIATLVRSKVQSVLDTYGK